MKKYEDYAPSSINGVEIIPSHWKEAPIKQLVEINPESVGEKTESDLLINYIDIGNVNSYGEIKEIQPIIFKDAPSRARRIVKKGDVLVSTVRTYLKAIAAVESDEENLIASTGFAVLRADEENVAAAYLKYAVRGGYFIEEVVANSTGVSYPAISSTPFSRIKLVMPPYDEQRAIAAYLDRKTAQLDTLLAQKEALLRKLHQKRQALINEAVTQGLDPAAPRKPSSVAWLGDVPAHWEIRRLKTLSSFVTSGSRGWAEYYSDEGSVFLRIGNLSTSSIDLKLHNLKRVNPPEGAEGARTSVQTNDLLISITALLGAVGVVPEEVQDAYVNQHIALVRLKQDLILHRWAAYFLISAVGQHQFKTLTNGGTKEGLTLADIANLILLYPTYKEQCAIADFIDCKTERINEATATIHTQIQTLKAYRQSLISEVVTGKVDVRPATPKAAPERSRPTVVQTSLFE